ncbi:MAG: IspD/TarI family cytidylyltransferase [Planctomycetota bacterium]|jgi:2-C-methyl-D-erythritol 4-phosphate cytidylyltransferase
MNIAVIIAAAGSSTRFGGSDKLGQDLGGRPLLMRTLEVFSQREEVKTIIVAAPPDRLDAFKERYGATLGFHGATVVAGGRAERWESIRNALEALPEDATHVAVHDAARPGVGSELLDRLFEAAASLPAVIPGVPVTATVKRVAAEPVEVAPPEDDAIAQAIMGDTGRRAIAARPVVETLDRTGLVQVQTPQVFQVELLRRAYAQDRLDGATDDATLVERLGEPVHVVDGDVTNFKITTPADLRLMRSVMGVKPPAERPVHKRF